MTREERTKLIRHLKYNRSIGADYVITDKDVDEIIKALEQEPCEDAISRQVMLDKIYNVDEMEEFENSNIFAKHYAEIAKALPPVTPQPKTGHISINDVMSVFDDYMCGEVDEDETNTFLEMLKDKAESEK